MEYHDKVLNSGNLITITDIGKSLRMMGAELNKILSENNIKKI